MKYFVDHDVREIYLIAPVKAHEAVEMLEEIQRSNPITGSYYTFIIPPPTVPVATSKPITTFKTAGDA
jgi:hypothetical protein